ncbi:unknown [Prevotella sp. CAG:873]|nr:unknown [Prevotella sp. CAG:873]
MEQMEVLYWTSIVKMAKTGDPEATETLTAQNKIRKEQNRPTVEQELQAIADKGAK